MFLLKYFIRASIYRIGSRNSNEDGYVRYLKYELVGLSVLYNRRILEKDRAYVVSIDNEYVEISVKSLQN